MTADKNVMRYFSQHSLHNVSLPDEKILPPLPQNRFHREAVRADQIRMLRSRAVPRTKPAHSMGSIPYSSSIGAAIPR